MREFNILAMMREPGHARGDPNLSWESSRWLLIHLPHHSRQFSPGPEPGQLRELKYNPTDPAWFDRDRFVLSNGHGSMLVYALLHLTGYDLSIDDLKQFRQLHSRTPGHPELGYTPGVETTTGPLGQGLANAVGFALAEKVMAAQFNRPGHNIVDHHTYVFLGDGCMMEGISHEVASLAGTLGLSKLTAFYD